MNKKLNLFEKVIQDGFYYKDNDRKIKYIDPRDTDTLLGMAPGLDSIIMLEKHYEEGDSPYSFIETNYYESKKEFDFKDYGINWALTLDELNYSKGH